MTINAPAKQYGDYKVRLMQDSDAQDIVALYRAIYGEHFPIREMYNPKHIIQQQEEGLMYRVVLVDASGKILAHHALYRLKETYKGLYEAGQGMVWPEYRGKNFSNFTQDYIATVLFPVLNAEECWGESVTNHVMMQKSALYVGVKETGIELEVMPAQSYVAEQSASGRVGAVVCSIAFGEKPHTVFLPAPYADLLKRIYANAKKDRRMEASTQTLPAGAKTRYADTFISGAGVYRLTLFEAGSDVADIVAGLVKKHKAAGAEVFQVFLPLDKAWSGALTEVLNRQGFFFCALIPRWFDADGLILQKLVHPTDYDVMKIYSDLAKDLLKFIIQDRARVEALPAG